MSSAGHVLDMIRRQQANRKLQKQARIRMSERRDQLSEQIRTTETYNEELFSRLSISEIARNKKRIHTEMKKEHLLVLAKTITFTIVLIIVLAYGVFGL